MSWRLLLAAGTLLVAGCASQDAVSLEYEPVAQPVPALAAKAFSITVEDQRTYVWSQEKPPTYIGNVRHTGAVTNVLNDNGLTLAAQVKQDLGRELRSLGLAENDSAPANRISVRILEWNFRAAIKARYLYRAEISVADAQGKLLESSAIKDEKEIVGSVGKPAQESVYEDAANFYGGFIRRLVRENPAILAALGR
jgi:hypothetical protein